MIREIGVGIIGSAGHWLDRFWALRPGWAFVRYCFVDHHQGVIAEIGYSREWCSQKNFLFPGFDFAISTILEGDLSTAGIRHLGGMPLLSEEIVLLSFIIGLAITRFIAVLSFVVGVLVSRLHGKSHQFGAKFHAVLRESIMEGISRGVGPVPLSIWFYFLFLQNFNQALTQLLLRDLLRKFLVSASLPSIIEGLLLTHSVALWWRLDICQVKLVDHGLKTFPSIRSWVLIIVEDFDTAPHPCVNQALIRKFPCVGETHAESCAAGVLLIWLIVWEL